MGQARGDLAHPRFQGNDGRPDVFHTVGSVWCHPYRVVSRPRAICTQPILKTPQNWP
jgi:hypothetical protein